MRTSIETPQARPPLPDCPLARHDCDVLQAVLDFLPDPHVLIEAVRDSSGHCVDFVYLEANKAACEFKATTKDRMAISVGVTIGRPSEGADSVISRANREMHRRKATRAQ